MKSQISLLQAIGMNRKKYIRQGQIFAINASFMKKIEKAREDVLASFSYFINRRTK